MTGAPLHPAKFGRLVLDALGRLVREEADALGRRPLVLDPFGGVGRVHELRPWADTVAVELEAPWVRQRRRNSVRGNALRLPVRSGSVDVVSTSPVYGNRMSDHHNARDPSTRRSYTHDLRAMTGDPSYRLHPANVGVLPWGAKYRESEAAAMAEMWRVLRPGGLLLLVLSNYFRKPGSVKRLVPCVEWHMLYALGHGWLLEGALPVGSPRYRFGANRDDRVTSEFVLQLRRPDAATEPTLYPSEPHHAIFGANERPRPSAAPAAPAAQEAAPCT